MITWKRPGAVLLSISDFHLLREQSFKRSNCSQCYHTWCRAGDQTLLAEYGKRSNDQGRLAFLILTLMSRDSRNGLHRLPISLVSTFPTRLHPFYDWLHIRHVDCPYLARRHTLPKPMASHNNPPFFVKSFSFCSIKLTPRI